MDNNGDCMAIAIAASLFALFWLAVGFGLGWWIG